MEWFQQVLPDDERKIDQAKAKQQNTVPAKQKLNNLGIFPITKVGVSLHISDKSRLEKLPEEEDHEGAYSLCFG